MRQSAQMAAVVGSDQAFDYLRKMVHERAAIVLDQDKRYLLEARLGPLLLSERLASFDELVSKLGMPDGGALRQRVIEAMTTHETSFFRDKRAFQALRYHVIPQLIAERGPLRRINIWCGASSTGQEPFSIAMTIKEYDRVLAGWNVDIVATDISNEVLTRARTGTFSQLEVDRGLTPALLSRFFDKAGTAWRLKEDLRRMVNFRQLNLIDSWPHLHDLDVVFLRNVLIYFDVPTKRRIFEKVCQALRVGGYLFLGSVESTLNLSDSFKEVASGKSILYQRT
ncbi:MAG TPA: protein-glutamate O-methyltransferase CheR, partial [Polyangia bacterium]|nr:protein-glutamate O-methyltransferase CheR [Polyangia bacterium]